MKTILDSIKKHQGKFFLAAIVASLFIFMVSCASTTPITQRPGAQLWGENCGHCHNIRSPKALTDAQWDVAVLHMRTRANLTADEARKIVEFMKSAN